MKDKISKVSWYVTICRFEHIKDEETVSSDEDELSLCAGEDKDEDDDAFFEYDDDEIFRFSDTLEGKQDHVKNKTNLIGLFDEEVPVPKTDSQKLNYADIIKKDIDTDKYIEQNSNNQNEAFDPQSFYNNCMNKDYNKSKLLYSKREFTPKELKSSDYNLELQKDTYYPGYQKQEVEQPYKEPEVSSANLMGFFTKQTQNFPPQMYEQEQDDKTNYMTYLHGMYGDGSKK